MVTRTKKDDAGAGGKTTEIKESNEEMESLATSLGRGLELAVKVKDLAATPGAKPSKEALKKIRSLFESVAASAPPQLSSDTEV